MSGIHLNLDSLFLAALEIESPEERAAFLGQSCGGDVALRKEVEKLLESHRVAGDFLEKPALRFEDGNDLADVLQAGLAPAFPADGAVVIGNAGHSVLQALGRTIDVPRVMLRDARQ